MFEKLADRESRWNIVVRKNIFAVQIMFICLGEQQIRILKCHKSRVCRGQQEGVRNDLKKCLGSQFGTRISQSLDPTNVNMKMQYCLKRGYYAKSNNSGLNCTKSNTSL